MFKPIFINQKLKNANLTSCSYSCGGGMLGGRSSSRLEKNKDGNVKYIVENAKTHRDRAVTKTYDASEEDLELIKKLAIKYNMYAASRKGPSPIQAMDAETCTLSFYFDDGTSFSVSDTQNLSSTQAKNAREIAQTFSQFAKGEPIVEIENHELGLVLDGYHLAYILKDSQATETLLDNIGEYLFTGSSGAKEIELPVSLDIEELDKTNNPTAGLLCYDKENNKLLFVYEDYESNEDLYILGELEYASTSSFELLKNLEEKEYSIYQEK